MRTNHGLAPSLLVVIIAAVLAIGGGVYVLSKASSPPLQPPQKVGNDAQTNSATRLRPVPIKQKHIEAGDWRVYEDADFGFALKYPPGYTLSRRAPTDGKPNGYVLIKPPTRGIGNPYVEITLPPSDDATANLTARNLDGYLIKEYLNADYTVIVDSSEKLLINNWPALKQEYRAGELVNGELRLEGPSSTLNGIRYVFYDNRHSFVILKAARENASLLDQVAQTFQFLK